MEATTGARPAGATPCRERRTPSCGEGVIPRAVLPAAAGAAQAEGREVADTVLVIGGDHLGGMAGHLRRRFGEVQHVNGRTRHTVEIPAGTEVVVVLVDYVSHSLADSVKRQAKARGLPCIHARRNWSTVRTALEQRLEAEG